jgi:hypothetical protein
MFNSADYKPLQEDDGKKGNGIFDQNDSATKIFDFDYDDDEEGGEDEGGEDDGDAAAAKVIADQKKIDDAAAAKAAKDAKADEDPEEDPADPADKSKGLSFDDIDEEDGDPDDEEDDDPLPGKEKKSTGGKEPLSKVFKKLFDDEVLLPFDEDKKLEDYSQKDFIELISANLDGRKDDLRDEVTTEIFESLPEEMQTAMTYIANGGSDMKTLFAKLSTVTDLKDLDPEKNAEAIARQYLRETNYGDAELIDEQITEWKEGGNLGNKAKRFKPKLIEAHNARNKVDIEKADTDRKERQRLGQEFQDSMIESLGKKELNGIPLTKELRNSLAEGILTNSHDSKLGKTKTNELFHLIEKYQTDEKKPDLIAEALYLLRDPEGYRKAVSQTAIREVDKDRVRSLKTSNEKRKAGGASGEDDDPEAKRTRKTVTRKPSGFFKR